VVFIEPSASDRVLNAVFPITVVVVVVGFSDTIEQCFVFESWTTVGDVPLTSDLRLDAPQQSLLRYSMRPAAAI
jgi:hypothetical protein